MLFAKPLIDRDPWWDGQHFSLILTRKCMAKTLENAHNWNYWRPHKGPIPLDSCGCGKFPGFCPSMPKALSSCSTFGPSSSRPPWWFWRHHVDLSPEPRIAVHFCVINCFHPRYDFSPQADMSQIWHAPCNQLILWMYFDCRESRCLLSTMAPSALPTELHIFK
jgi:hypothetical protein